MNRALVTKPLGGLLSLTAVIALLSACAESPEEVVDSAYEEQPEVSAPAPSGADVITSIDADGNVAPFGFASREPVEVPPLETEQASAPASTPETAAAGAESALFAAQCSSCHGRDAQGVEGLGVSLVDSQLVADSSAADLTEFLKVGRMPDSPDSQTGVPMPGFAWMTAEQLAEIVGYIQQL